MKLTCLTVLKAALLLAVPSVFNAHATPIMTPVIDTVIHATGNPIITHKYTADPAALVLKTKFTCTPATT